VGRGFSGRTAAWLACAILIAGCSSSARRSDPVAAPPASPVGDLMGSADLTRLAAVTRERAASVEGEGGYRIGPDDLLDIRIPDLLDAQPFRQGAASGAPGPSSLAASPTFHQGHRVDELGEISIPLVGTIRAAGSTPAELEAEIKRRLVASGLLRRPQVAVQIAEYRSRVVAVVGSVERPGTYPLTRPDATVADMIWAAGGPGKDAGRVVQFSPARRDAPGAAADADARLAASAGTRTDADPGGPALQTTPIRIDLQALLQAADAGAPSLDPEVRPGDVINVSSAGSVLVEGWVDKPGSYPVTPGLTLSGAVVAAGGSVYAADLEAVTIRRMLAPGEQRLIPVDLAAIAEGRQADVPILDGDVISVPMHSTKIVPYGLWKVGREVIHVGASVPIF
jgi:polysaccharide export outer membrane protein